MIRILRILLIILAVLLLTAVVWWLIDTRGTSTTNTNTVQTVTTAPGDSGQTPEVVQIESPQDSDADGLSDSEEQEAGTRTDEPDTDADGLSDSDEVRIYKTNPLRADTDSDGFTDGNEVEQGFNPNGGGPLLNTEQAINEDRQQ